VDKRAHVIWRIGAHGELTMANRLWQIGIWQKGIWRNDLFPVSTKIIPDKLLKSLFKKTLKHSNTK